MEIKKELYDENEQVGNFEEIASSIRVEDMGLAFDMVSRNLYSNPIGSFVRELVSNGVDANKDNSIATKVAVNVFKEDDLWYFQVLDQGKGMSPTHFREVYMKWFNSDKRDTNEKIGGWGLGSKSPLSYVEQYDVITISEGIEYHYIVARTSTVPTATLLSSKETDKPSGTTVKVEVQQKDLWELNAEMTAQLCYFDNVIVKDDMYFYDNLFKILDSEYFKVRNNRHPFGNDMHIILGQVTYPINWTFLGIDRVNCPVGIKFDIGELPVTLSREEINYNDDSIKDIIISRINKTKDYLKTIYEKDLVTDDIFELVNLWESERRSVKLGDYDIYYNTNERYYPRFRFEGREFKIQKQALIGLLNIFSYRLLNKTKISDSRFTLNYDALFNAGYSKFYRKEEITHWGSLYRENGKIIKMKKITYNTIKSYASFLGIAEELPKFNRRGGLRTVIEPGGLRLTYRFLKYLEKKVEAKTDGNYDFVPQSFIDETKEAQRLLKEERKGNITYYSLEGKQTTVSVGTLLDLYKNIFYISRDSTNEELAAYETLFDCLPEFFKKNNKLIILSPSTIKKIKRIGGFVPCRKVFLHKQLPMFFGRLKQADESYNYGIHKIRVSSISKYYHELFLKIRDKLNFRENQLYSLRGVKNREEGVTKRDTVDIDINLYDYFHYEINKVAKINPMLQMQLDELKKVSFPLRLLSDIYHDNQSTRSISMSKGIIRTYKLTKLNINYYEH